MSKKEETMASLNTRRTAALPPQGGVPPAHFEPSNTLRTHEGAPAALISPELMLRRSVCSCLLWEDEFYEDGRSVAQRITELVAQVSVSTACELAVDARSSMNLRHVPLLILAAAAAPGRGGSRVLGDALAEAIQRPDELSEFIAIYAKTYGVKPSAVKRRLSAQVKRGLALAFGKFDQYQLAKYLSSTGAQVRGRDVMFLAHPKPRDEAQAKLFERIAKKEPIAEGGADTWEVALSRGANKGETFTRLLEEGKLGYLALLRNLRNMRDSGVDEALVTAAITARRGARRVLPFRFVAAARACPTYASALDEALIAQVANTRPLPGMTFVLVDVSGSMDTQVSGKSGLKRMDAAATLGAVIPGDVRVFTFSEGLKPVTGEARGLSGVEQIVRNQSHGGTNLGAALRGLPSGADRLIVITDEQSHDHVQAPAGIERCYLINVASARNGVGYGPRWVHLDGFSEQVIRWIEAFELVSLAA